MRACLAVTAHEHSVSTNGGLGDLVRNCIPCTARSLLSSHLGVFLVVFRARGLTAGEPRTWQVQLMLALRGIFLYHYTRCVFEVYLYIWYPPPMDPPILG